MERSTTLMKIAFRIYDKCETELTDEEKTHVNEKNEDFY